MQFCDNVFYDDQFFMLLHFVARFHCEAGTLFITSNDDITLKNDDYTPEYSLVDIFLSIILRDSGIKLLRTILKRENIHRENQRCGTEYDR